MNDQRIKSDLRRPMGIKKVDTKEFELPETTFIRDIDTKVFQGIVLECLAHIDGIEVAEEGFIDSIFGRSSTEINSGVQSEQDSHNQSVSIKIDVNVRYGVSIPEKAEEIQNKVVEEITKLTGLRVSSVQIVFKNLIVTDETKASHMLTNLERLVKEPAPNGRRNNEYSDDF